MYPVASLLWMHLRPGKSSLETHSSSFHTDFRDQIVSSVPMMDSTSAVQLKEEGNTAFREKLYASAVDLYSQAISMCFN